ncbi:MAG: cytochrome c [Mariprofundaceae bacterium]|nr:cytochrome c [Mariprofundaceae bacterium]
MRLRQLMILMLPLLLSTPALAEEEVVAADKIAVVEAPQADVKHGKEIFDTICTHCHRTDYEASSVGAPGLKDVLERHSAEWINTWITSPEAFAEIDETAKDLMSSNPYGLKMPTIPEMQIEQNRKDIIEYLKTLK